MKLRTLIIIFLISMTAVAQTAGSADNLFNQKDYVEAEKAYKHLLNARPSNVLYNYRYARCNYELGDYDTAIDHFILSGTRYPLTDYYLGDSYFQLYQFDNAIEYFEEFANGKSTNFDLLQDAKDKIHRAEIASKLIRRVEDIAIIDTLIVCKDEFLDHYELSKETGSFQIEKKTVNDKIIDLVSFITQRGDRKLYSDLVDGKTQLFKANKLLDGWSQAENLSTTLNTYDNINYPFLMLDGITLYFAADNEHSIGGYDIFMTRFNSGTNEYLRPDNIGMPFNSFYNDYMLVIDETLGSGWFVSDRFQPEDKVCIYQFQYEEKKKYLNPEYSQFMLEYAQLKQFKKAVIPTEEKFEHLLPERNNPFSDKVLIQINDSIIYTDINQFKSKEAVTLWQSCIKTREELHAKESLLIRLRELYDDAEEVADKQKLVYDITNLETTIIGLRLKVKENAKIIRNKEIKLIKEEETE